MCVIYTYRTKFFEDMFPLALEFEARNCILVVGQLWIIDTGNALHSAGRVSGGRAVGNHAIDKGGRGGVGGRGRELRGRM